jgi:ADP-ribose pyrophosphatase YjhB (NUDIX family)
VLQDAAAYRARRSPAGCKSLPAARDAGAADLAMLAGAALGHRVALGRSNALHASVARRPLALHVGREPLWYVTAAEWTDPVMLAEGLREGWADPEDDPSLIDWDKRLAEALVMFSVDPDGQPLHPYGHVTRWRWGRNGLGRWGETRTADMGVTCTYRGVRYLLLVRRDTGEWALPGGFVDPGESIGEAAVRELREETGLVVDLAACRELAPRVVDDPRSSDRAWIVTTVFLVDLGEVSELPAVAGASDAQQAAWVPARSYDCVARALRAGAGVSDVWGEVYPAHVPLIAAVLAGEE